MKICVFCGSSEGSSPVFADGAVRMGQTLARAGVGLVYGGGKVGLMGILADAALTAGGKVTGVIPRSLLEREIAHDGLTDLHMVSNAFLDSAYRAMLMVDADPDGLLCKLQNYEPPGEKWR